MVSLDEPRRLFVQVRSELSELAVQMSARSPGTFIGRQLNNYTDQSAFNLFIQTPFIISFAFILSLSDEVQINFFGLFALTELLIYTFTQNRSEVKVIIVSICA